MATNGDAFSRRFFIPFELFVSERGPLIATAVDNVSFHGLHYLRQSSFSSSPATPISNLVAAAAAATLPLMTTVSCRYDDCPVMNAIPSLTSSYPPSIRHPAARNHRLMRQRITLSC